MHALRRYLQDGLDARGWQQRDLARESGLSRQRVSQMLTDDRGLLPSVPQRDTLQALARAFGVAESTVTAVAFEAMGYDLAAVRREADLSTASTEDIVRALAQRLGVGLDREDGDGHGQQSAPSTRAGDARDEEQDPGGHVTELHRMDQEARAAAAARRAAEVPDDLAARKTGKASRVQRARDQQDQDAQE
ncbi:helix-turn-helix domain-containing protein [Ornithinimicrobium sp. LYQ92]|uniref:helix-turn-helix domain-containing protein n=1 Tax=Serinicoccus sp. LYQ92 TaxID=3378798 RepID=UPI003854208A